MTRAVEFYGPGARQGQPQQAARRLPPCLQLPPPPPPLMRSDPPLTQQRLLPLPTCLTPMPSSADRAKWLGPFSEGAVPSYLKGEPLAQQNPALSRPCLCRYKPAAAICAGHMPAAPSGILSQPALLLRLTLVSTSASSPAPLPTSTSEWHVRHPPHPLSLPAYAGHAAHAASAVQASSLVTTAGTPPACLPTPRRLRGTARSRSSTPAG